MTARRYMAMAALSALLGAGLGGVLVRSLDAGLIGRLENDLHDIDKVIGQQVRWHAGLSANFDLLREKLQESGVIALTKDLDADWAEGGKYTVSPRRCSCGAP